MARNSNPKDTQELVQKILELLSEQPVEDGVTALSMALVYAARIASLEWEVVEKTLKLAWKGVVPLADAHREALAKLKNSQDVET